MTAGAISPRTAYVTNWSGSSVTPIDTVAKTAGPSFSAGSTPIGIAITPDGVTGYVTNSYQSDPSTVTPFDIATHTAGGAIGVGQYPYGFPVAIAITPDGTTAYVSTQDDNYVTAIDVATNTAGARIPMTSVPIAIAITPDGKTAYVSNLNDQQVTPIDIATNTVEPSIWIGDDGSNPDSIAITPDGATAYVANYLYSSIVPIDIATNTTGPAIEVGNGPDAIAITADGDTAYVANRTDNTVTPVDVATNNPGSPIGVGSNPEAIAITPDGSTAFVANSDDNNVTPIDIATNSAGPPIGAGAYPAGIAITPDQSPTAAFTSDTATAGQPTGFDASTSSDPDGTVATYHWDYGDGVTAQTGSATLGHVYAEAGTYTATLTITDNEGCSTDQVFTGQTMSCNGKPAAQIAHQVTAIPKATPTITSSSATDATAGGAINDTAALASGRSPTGTIVFRAYGPADPTCASAPVFASSPVSVSGNGDYTSPDFSTTPAGDYRWTASYSGDGENESASTVCNAANATSTVTPASPEVTITAADGVAGAPINATASLADAYFPTGEITFKAYGPADADCLDDPAFTDTQAVAGNGDYASSDFTPAVSGVYRWTADYPGNASNEPSSTACSDPNGVSTVGKASPTITSSATGATIGGAIGDTATLAAGVLPTGTITFAAYPPGAPDCSQAPASTTVVPVSGNGAYEAAPFTATQLGSYIWTAAYSGDADNLATSTACGDPSGIATVGMAAPTLTAAAGRVVALGAKARNTAMIAGGYNPTGRIAFKLYRPGDTRCSRAPVFKTGMPISAAGSYRSAGFIPTRTGTYRWRAIYSGDANNSAVAGACNATKQTARVIRAGR